MIAISKQGILLSTVYNSCANNIFKFAVLNGLPPPHSTILQRSRLITKQERLAVECLKPKYQGPCKMFQRRKCVRRKNTERGLWKMVKCRGNAANNFLLMESQYSPVSEHNDEEIPTGKFDILVVKLSPAQYDCL